MSQIYSEIPVPIQQAPRKQAVITCKRLRTPLVKSNILRFVYIFSKNILRFMQSAEDPLTA